jgi:aromatic-L-amino-acid/L-tryptophan decarboxylase
MVPHMTPDEFRRRGHQMVDWIADYMGKVGEYPVLSRNTPNELFNALPAAAPEKGEPWENILRDIDRLIIPGVTHWQSPRFFAYFSANASAPGMLGEMLAGALGIQGMLWTTSPACTELETKVMDWLADMIGLPARFKSTSTEPQQGGGVIQCTASDSNLVALLAARYRAARRMKSDGPGAAHQHDDDSLAALGAPDFRTFTAYTSTQAHSSVVKGLIVAGMPRENLRLIDVDEKLAMKPRALADAIARDRAAGLHPFFVTATTGTTSSTAIDPLRPIGEVCRREGLWLHIDAAFAGAACVCPEFRWMIDGIELADSFVFDPHKWLLTNLHCSAFWVSDRAALTGAMSVTPEYLKNAMSQSGQVIDYRDWQVPLGRRFNALKLWFVIRHYGVEGLRAHIREHVRLATLMESIIRDDPKKHFEIAAPRSCALVCFRLPPPATDEDNKRVLEAVNRSGEAYLSHTVIPVREPDGSMQPRVVLRLAIAGSSTTEPEIRRAWRALCAAAEGVLVR